MSRKFQDREFQNTAARDVIFIKAQAGEYFGEDDFDRLADGDYRV